MKNVFLIGLLISALGLQAQYNALLWKISGNGLKQPSYLFGTMHSGDERVIHMSDSALTYLKQTKAYAMELDPNKALSLDILPKIMMGKEYSLQKMISAHEYTILDSVIKASIGYSVKLFDNVSPVFVASIFELNGMGLSDGRDRGNTEVLDIYLYNKAKKQKKKLIGIETVDEQLSALGSLSYQEQADMLIKEIDDFEANKTEEHDVLDYYLKQDLDELAKSNEDSTMPEKFYKALVTDRNKRMADRIAEFIQNQPTFIAIGALHLPNADGVIMLLRSKGFTVEAVR